MFKFPDVSESPIGAVFIFLMTPAYLYLVFIKSIGDASAVDLIYFFGILLLYFVPMQIIKSEKGLIIDFEEFLDDYDLDKIFSVMLQAIIVIPLAIYVDHVHSFWIDMSKFILWPYALVIWWMASEMLLVIFMESSFFNQVKLLVVYFLLVTFITIYAAGSNTSPIWIILVSFFVFSFSTPQTVLMLFQVLMNLDDKIKNAGKNINGGELADNIFFVFVLIYPIMAVAQIPAVSFAIDLPKEYLSYIIMATSSFGVYFQLRLVLSAFIEDERTLLGSIIILFIAFYSTIYFLMPSGTLYI